MLKYKEIAALSEQLRTMMEQLSYGEFDTIEYGDATVINLTI
jgi:hypothetical protein